MPPRFLERMQRQSDVLRDVFGDPENDPPPYPFSPSRTNSSSSSFQYRRSADLSAYQNRFSQESTPASSVAAQHRRQASSQSSASLRYRQSDSASSEPPPGYAQATTPTRAGFDITAIPRDSLILVTGANSYQGLHIVEQLLRQGFRVRGTVRDASKAVWTAKFFLDRYGAGRYRTAVIPDMAAQHAFDLAVRGCSGVIHVASVTRPSVNPHEVITPSIAGAINALEAAAKEPEVRRVVLTSCVSAAVSCDRATAGREVVGGESWNMADFQEAWEPPPYLEEEVEQAGDGGSGGNGDAARRMAAIAASSKMQTEQAVWRWYWERRPGYVLNSVLPDTLWGAPLCPQQQQQQIQEQEEGEQHLPQSVALFSSLISRNDSSGNPTCGHFTNPSDSATLHLAALLFPDVQHERIFAVSAPWSLQTITETLSKLRLGSPQPAEQTDPTSSETAPEDHTLSPSAPQAEELLKRMGRRDGWRGLEESLREVVEAFSLVEAEEDQRLEEIRGAPPYPPPPPPKVRHVWELAVPLPASRGRESVGSGGGGGQEIK